MWRSTTASYGHNSYAIGLVNLSTVKDLHKVSNAEPLDRVFLGLLEKFPSIKHFEIDDYSFLENEKLIPKLNIHLVGLTIYLDGNRGIIIFELQIDYGRCPIFINRCVFVYRKNSKTK